MAGADDLLAGDVDEEDSEYLYNDWGVDYVDLDFKTVSDLRALLSDRQARLTYSLYNVSQKMDAKLKDAVQDILTTTTAEPEQESEPNITSQPETSTAGQQSSSFHISDLHTYHSSTENYNLSSTNSIQENSSISYFSHNQSSILTENPQANPLGSVQTFYPLPSQEPSQTDYGNIFINLGFLIFFLLVCVFVIIQCSHLAVYIFRAADKRRARDRRLPLNTGSSYPSQEYSADARIESENIRNPVDMVVEVDSLNNISHHQMVMTPQSPVSVLQNSPLYSPVRDSSSLSLSLPCPPSEDRTSCEDKTSPWSVQDRTDEGIETEEDIDGSAFKQLILQNVVEETKCQTLLSNFQTLGDRGTKTGRTGRQSARGNSVESPSISLCSEVYSPPSLCHPQDLEQGFDDIFANVEKVVNPEECLI